MTVSPESGAPDGVSRARFAELHRRLRGAAPGAGPGAASRGTLETITPECVRAAAAEVRSGLTVSLAVPVETVPEPDNPDPATHRLTAPVPGEPVGDGLHFARDRFAMNVHGDADSHLDALCHVIYDGTLHGDVPADSLTAGGATALTLDPVRDGIVGRGVLLDIPRLRGVPWLEPGTSVTRDDLTAAETRQDSPVRRGDLLLVRVGHRRRREELGPWDTAHARAGLHPTAVEFLAERGVALLGGDGNNDTAPSTTRGVGFPVHVLCVHAMGMPLLDYLQLEDLGSICAREGRWTFSCVVAPLRLPGATGCPVNPIAIL